MQLKHQIRNMSDVLWSQKGHKPPMAGNGNHPTQKMVMTGGGGKQMALFQPQYPLVMIKIAIEHGHRNSEFSHSKW